jgi:hypothetical protein
MHHHCQALAHPAAPKLLRLACTHARAGVRLSRPLLLVSDLDDTLLPCKLPQLPQHEQAAAVFREVWNRSRALGLPCKFVINTGRWGGTWLCQGLNAFSKCFCCW